MKQFSKSQPWSGLGDEGGSTWTEGPGGDCRDRVTSEMLSLNALASIKYLKFPKPVVGFDFMFFLTLLEHFVDARREVS